MFASCAVVLAVAWQSTTDSVDPATSLSTADLAELATADYHFASASETAGDDSIRLALLQDSSSSSASTQPDLDDADVDAAPGFYGQEDTWWWSIQGGAGTNFEEAEQFHLGVGLSYFVVEDFSLEFELNAMHFTQPGDDASGGNFNLLMRYHFLHDASRTWTVYLDGGAGILLTTDHVPYSGSSFNFTPQAGVGATFDVGDGAARLLTGLRWHHISNANTFSDNPGRDNLMVYAGVTFPF